MELGVERGPPEPHDQRSLSLGTWQLSWKSCFRCMHLRSWGSLACEGVGNSDSECCGGGALLLHRDSSTWLLIRSTHLNPSGLEYGWRSMIHAGTWEGEAKTTESLSQSGVYKTLSTHKFIRIWACMVEHTRGIRVLNPDESLRTPFLEFERKSTGQAGCNA